MLSIYANKALLGTNGFYNRRGPRVGNLLEAQVKKAMLNSSNQVYIISDSSKAHQNALIEFADGREFDGLIVDGSIDSITLESLHQLVEVMIAD